MGVKPAAQQPIAVQREIITGLSRTVPDETPLIDPENSQDEIREIHAVVNAQTADEVNQDPRLINAQQFFHQLSGFKKRSKFLIVLNNIEASGTRKKIAKLINLCMKHGQNLSLFNEDERKIIEAIEKNFGNNFIGTISLLTSTDETLRKLKLKDPLTDQPISSYAKFFDLTKPSLDLFIKQLSSFEQRSNFVNILNNIEDNNVVQEKVVKLINLCTQHGKNLSSLNNKEKEIIEAIEKNFGEDFITIISLLPNSDRTLVKLEPQDPLTNQPFNSYANFCDLTKPSLDLFIKQLSSFEQRFNFLNILNNIEGKGSGVPSKVPKLINLCMKHGQDPFSLNNDEETEIIEAIEENFSKDFISIISLLPNANPTLAKLNLQDPLTKKIIKSYAKFFDLTEPSLDLFINQLSSFEQRSKFLNILNNTEGKSIQEKVAKLINLCEQRGQDLSLLNDEEKKIIEAIEKNFGEDFIGIISLLPSNVRVLAKLNLQDTLRHCCLIKITERS
jgi:phosphotransferase system HPr-like phosphotransfer protein